MLVTEDLPENDVRLLFCQGPSGDTPEDKLLRYISGFVGQKERQAITERTTRGKIARTGRGVMPVGSGRGLYGYTLDKVAKRRVISEEEAVVVRSVFAKWVEGGSLWSITCWLNQSDVPTKGDSKWHPLTVERMLTNSSYCGLTYYGKERSRKLPGGKRDRSFRDKESWVLVEGFTPAIVSQQTFDAAQQRFAEPRLRPGRAIQPYLLRKHLFCGHCGSPMVGSMMQGNTRYRYYRCRGAWANASEPKQCNAHYIRADALDVAVWGVVRRVLENPAIVLAELRRQRGSAGEPLEGDFKRLRREISNCKDQQSRLVKLYALREIDDDYIRKHAGPIKVQQAAFEAELARLEAQVEAVKGLDRVECSLTAFCERVSRKVASLGFDDKRLALRALEIKAAATEASVRVQGVVVNESELDILTTAQTWASPRGRSRRSPLA
jgi:site-specific DNA recombinase